VVAGSDEILAERRLRSSELALEAARRRLREAEGELFDLRRRVAQLETSLLEREADAAAEIASLRAEIEAQRRARKRAEQVAHGEETRRHELEDELAERTAPSLEGVERELGAAQRRIRELEAETELVRRHAAEFEHRIRVVVGQAWEWMTELGERFGLAAEELEVHRRRFTTGGPAAGPGTPTRWEEGADPTQAAPLEPERLDAALARLRAARGEPEQPRRRWWPGRP
jgi:chromosome segregation ATPase